MSAVRDFRNTCDILAHENGYTIGVVGTCGNPSDPYDSNASPFCANIYTYCSPGVTVYTCLGVAKGN